MQKPAGPVPGSQGPPTSPAPCVHRPRPQCPGPQSPGLLLSGPETILTCAVRLVCVGLLDALVPWFCWGTTFRWPILRYLDLAFLFTGSSSTVLHRRSPTPSLSPLGNLLICPTLGPGPQETTKIQDPSWVLWHPVLWSPIPTALSRIHLLSLEIC